MPEQLSAPITEHKRYGRLAIPAVRVLPPTSFSTEMTAEPRDESTDKCRGEMAEDRPTLQQQHRSGVW